MSALVSETILNRWEIICMHTPETVDKIMINFRKRGMTLNSIEYHKIDDEKAKCTVEFEDTPAGSSKIFSNMQRLYDIVEMKRLTEM